MKSGARRFTRTDILPAALAFLALLVGVRIFAFFLYPYAVQIGYDEGYEAAAAERVIDGRGLPYVDAVSIRGPFLYWSLAIVHLIVGRFDWTGTRVLGLLSCAVTVASIFFAGWAARWPLAGAIAGALYVYVITIYYDPGGGIGVHAEPVAIAYICFAFFLMAYALYRSRTPRWRIGLLAAGGAVATIGVLTKQTMGLCAAPLLIWVISHAAVQVAETTHPGWPRWRAGLVGWVLPFVAGGAGLVLLVVLRYAFAGELGTLLFWSMGAGAKLYMAAYKGKVIDLALDWFMAEPWAILGVLLALTVAAAPALGRAPTLSWRGIVEGIGHSGFETTVGLMGVCIMIGAALPHRLWPHYFLPVWPFFGLTVGLLLERVAVRGMFRPVLAQFVVVAVCGSLLLGLAKHELTHLDDQRTAGEIVNPRPSPVCTEINRIAGKSREAIFVWGVAGDVYVTCRRRSASMFTHAMVLLGIMPPSWEPRPELVPPGVREKLLAELTANPPKVIIDHQILRGPGTSMAEIPMYASFMTAHYCRVSSVGASRDGDPLMIYARRDLPACNGGR